MNRLQLVLFCLIFFMACDNPPSKYGESNDYDDTPLKAFLAKKQFITSDILDSTLIIFLQDEDCICTKSHIDFTLNLFNSRVYEKFKKILCLKSKNHKILAHKLPPNLILYTDEALELERNGIISVTDRVILYKDNTIKYNIDMHNEQDLSKIEKLFLDL